MRFDTINGQLCIMLEKPVPLTKDAKMPCVCGYIKDDSPMGRYNNALRYAESFINTKFIITKIKDNPYYAGLYGYAAITSCIARIEQLEILGYPVADGSAEWALWQMQQGKMVCRKGWKGDTGLIIVGEQIYTIDTDSVIPIQKMTTNEFIDLTKFEGSDTGWQIYELKKELCPACNGTGVVLRKTPNDATQTDLPASDATQPQYEVGDWVECDDDQFQLIKKSNADLETRKAWVARDIDGDESDLYEDGFTRKLSSSEVRVKITLVGTVRSSINDSCFEISTPSGGWATIGYNEIDPATADLVRELIKKQDEK